MSASYFAHLSDLHLPLAQSRPPLRTLLSKRLFSYLSWKRSRHRIHRPEILDAVMADVRASGDHHLLVTGDLTNLALPDEFDRAQAWLARQGDAASVTVVPGNHDALVVVDWRDGLAKWRAWMGEVEQTQDFPFVKRVGEVALIGISTAVPTPPFMASGRVGDAQTLRLARILATLAHEGVFRVVMLHHPLTEGAVKSRKELDDRGAIRQVLMEFGAELVLHGHSHYATFEEIPGPVGMIPVVAAPSASADPDEFDEPAGWRRIGVKPGNDSWELSVESRFLASTGEMASGETELRTIPRPYPALSVLSLQALAKD